jgi:hypothetical protein
LKRTLTVAVVVGVITAVGTATAATLITSADIKNGTIKVKDINKKARKALKGNTGPQGPQGPQGPAGQNGANGSNGADGSARAYGLVNNSTGSPVMQKSKGGPSVRRSGNGVFCIKAGGIDPTSNVILTQLDASGGLSGFVTTATGFGAVVSSQCGSDEFQVLVYDANGGAPQNDESFAFLSP